MPTHNDERDNVESCYYSKNCPRLTIDISPTALPRPHVLDSATDAGLGRATPHALPREGAANDVTMTRIHCSIYSSPVDLVITLLFRSR